MKSTFKYITAMAVAAGSMALTGCNDLDTEPQNNYVTTDQKNESIAQNPELAAAGVVGISSSYSQYMQVYSSSHCDFGWPSVMMMMDCIGPDLVSPNTGYNWFASAGDYNFGTNNNYMNNLSWYYAYKVIMASNDVLKTIDPDTDDPQLMLFGAQGFANRAFMYFNLAQLFQQTYVGHEDLSCVPVITDLNSDEAAVSGMARSTVKEVYTQILSDLDKAIEMLEGSGLNVDRIADTGVKRFVSLGTAYGLRARVNLVMNNWSQAAADAQKAIEVSGATPLSIAEASVPGFNTSDAHNWMWGIYIQENDRVVTSGIVNFPSHMGSLNYGYATVGAWRYINESLYSAIPSTDCRKGWWLDANGDSPNLTDNQRAYLASQGAPAYTQVKFAPYQGAIGTTTNASDIPLMRVEEMYLIKAEAQAMSGDAAGGKSTLESFVQAYRDPSYTCSSTDAAGIQNAVWMQRRIELFGEGMCYFDLLRLNKGLDRRGGGWDSSWVYNIPAPLKPLLIPNGEMETNGAIGVNNDSWSKPTAVDDL